MTNLILFVNCFMEYLICFGVSVLVVLIACVIGISIRKTKNAKLEAEGDASKEAATEQS